MFALEFISSQRRVYVGSPAKANKSIYQSSYTEGPVCRETWSPAGIPGSALVLSLCRLFASAGALAMALLSFLLLF